jgi:VanZ family protein
MDHVSLPGSVSRNPSNRIRVGLWAVTGVYMAAIFSFSSLPGSRLPIQPGAWDHLLHFLAYWGLGASMALSVGHPAMSWRQAMIAGTLGIAYGASDEWHQSFVPLRDASLGDWIYDAAGVVVGVTLVWTLMRTRAVSGER